uniref:Uncharacterized protein n=1 Tax=Ditylenchus dipsaci TaxID=166011 RepID=A0A915DE10_9BILA
MIKDDELLIRNLFLKHYLQPKQPTTGSLHTIPRQALLKYSQNNQAPAEANTNAYSSFWRGRRTPTLLANAPLPYSDYTPTPCRWNCALHYSRRNWSVSSATANMEGYVTYENFNDKLTAGAHAGLSVGLRFRKPMALA